MHCCSSLSICYVYSLLELCNYKPDSFKVKYKYLNSCSLDSRLMGQSGQHPPALPEMLPMFTGSVHQKMKRLTQTQLTPLWKGQKENMKIILFGFSECFPGYVMSWFVS